MPKGRICIMYLSLFTSSVHWPTSPPWRLRWPPFCTVLTPTVLPNSFGVPPDLPVPYLLQARGLPRYGFCALETPQALLIPICLFAGRAFRLFCSSLFVLSCMYLFYTHICTIKRTTSFSKKLPRNCLLMWISIPLVLYLGTVYGTGLLLLWIKSVIQQIIFWRSCNI